MMIGASRGHRWGVRGQKEGMRLLAFVHKHMYECV